MYFGNRRPRGFHHTFRFSDERRDILDGLRRGVSPEQLAEQSLADASSNAGGRRRSTSQPLFRWLLAAALVLLLALLVVLYSV